MACTSWFKVVSNLQTYKREFIEFMVRSGALIFGEFTTKSGRQSPYFVNSGAYSTGTEINQLGERYTDAIVDHLNSTGAGVDVLFGPAYKGIPLVVAASSAMARRGLEVSYLFNRKEPKGHGEGGDLVGCELAAGDRVLIVDDVTTAGSSIRETMPLLRSAAEVAITGLVVSVDRCERGKGERSALDEVATDFNMPTFSIVTIHEIVDHLHGREVDGQIVIDDNLRERIESYLSLWAAA